MSLETYLFIVRLWREDSDRNDHSGLWRGSVKHAATGEQTYFLSLAELVRVLSQHSGFPPPVE